MIDAMITNFHLPRSTLLMLVSAFVDREKVLAAYAVAIKERYRFFSFGDSVGVFPKLLFQERSYFLVFPFF